MTRDETLDRLRDLQRRAHELRTSTDSPTLERTMQLFDMHCHIARWELGDIDGFTENIGGGEAPPRA